MKLTRSLTPGRMLGPAIDVAECAPRRERRFNNPMVPALSVGRDDRIRTMSIFASKACFPTMAARQDRLWCGAIQGVATSDHVP
jgi:hypothetical protein